MKKIAIILINIVFLTTPFLRAETVDLDKFLDLVKQHSKNLLLAEKEKEMAKANKKQAISTALPKIAATANYTRNLTSFYMYADFGKLGAMFGGAPGQVAKFKVKRDNEYSANIALQQTLFSPSVGSAIKAANQYKKLTDYAYTASERAIMAGAKKMFFQALLLKKFWQVSQAAEANAKDNYDNIELKFKNGVVSEFETLQAKVRWKNAIPKTAEAKRNYELALNNMKNWAGISVADSLNLQGAFDSYPDLPAKEPFEEILKKRPDYNAMLWEEKLRKTNLGAKKASYFPTLTGTAVYAYSAQSDYFKLDQQNNLYFAGLNLSFPIYTGGYRSSEVQKAQIEVEKSKVRIDQAKENIYNEISNIYLRLAEAHERIASAKATLQAAQKAFTIAESTAKSGLATQLQLKDARVGYDMAQMNYYSAIFDYLAAYYDWQRASGEIGK